MAEEFHGGVCGGVWWNPPQSLFSSGGGGGGGGGLWSMCSISQLDSGDDDGDSGHETINLKDNSYVCDTMNSMIFSSDLDSTFDSFGFGFSPTSSSTHWNQSYLFYNEGDELIIKEDVNTTIYEIKSNNLMIDNNLAQQGSSPMELTTVSSNSSEDSGSMNNEFISNINTNFPMSSSTSYLIRTLFDDDNDLQLIDPTNETPMSSINQDVNDIALRNIQVSSLNSLQPRSKLKKKSNSCANNLVTKVANEEVCDSNGNLNDQPLAKRPRIGTPSQLPTFKVRKEKLGDRITALQQLVSPFGKTDTASVLHEAIEYIKYLHNQVNDFNMLKNKKEHGKDLRSKGLCVMPITSTYPIAQETPVDFWTPNFGTIPLL